MVALQFSGLGFVGNITPKISNLSQLDVLTASRNRLRGALPTELGRLSNLERVGLSYIGMGGSTPFQLGQLECLVRLFLENNKRWTIDKIA